MLRIERNGWTDTIGLATLFTMVRADIPNVHQPGVLEPVATSEFRPGYAMDRLFTYLSLDIPIGVHSIYDVCRIQSELPMGTFSFGDRHVIADRKYDRWRDVKRYGGLRSDIVSLPKHPLRFKKTNWDRETNVVDPSYHCDFTMDRESTRFWSNITAWSYGGVPIRRYTPPLGQPDSTHLFQGVVLSYVGSQPVFSVDLVGNSPNIGNLVRSDTTLVSEDLLGKTVAFPENSGYARNTLYYRNFKFSSFGSAEEGGMVIEYDFENLASSTRGLSLPPVGIPVVSHTYHVTLTIGCKISYKSRGFVALPQSYPVDVDYQYSIGYYFDLINSWGNFTVPSAWLWPTGSGNLNAQVHLSSPHIVGKPGSTRDVPTLFSNTPILTGLITPGESALNKFSNFVDSIHPHIRSAACLSSNDALSKFTSESNFLESIPELPAMLKSIKDISRFGHLLKSLYKRDPHVIKETIDLMADGYLWYKYGGKPLVADVLESKRIAQEYFAEMDVMSQSLPGHLYGEFSYQVPDRVPTLEGKVLVTVRTKMVLRQSPSGILAFVLALNDVGLLPTMARIWDLVPFSFVIDWFTNLGDRYAAIDGMVIRSLVEVDYYIHTYSYRLYLNPGAYVPLQRRSNGDQPYLKVYIREISLYHPLILSDRYDFFPPTALKKRKLAAGALLWSSAT